MGRTYWKLCIEDFGKHLIESGDLDPIYLALNTGIFKDREQKHRWLLAYWCFYHAGVASYLSELPVDCFWPQFSLAAGNQAQICPAVEFDVNMKNAGWPRGKERRHFRGEQAIKATDELKAKFEFPHDAIPWLLKQDSAPIPYKVIKERVTQWRGFGNWIAYKVADMLDRCDVYPVTFAFDDAMYDEPRKAALILWKLKYSVPQESTIDNETAAVQEMVAYLVKHFKGNMAPPLFDRPIGFQEIETILCKWKSHLNGHYPLYNDIDEITHGIAPWVNICETAKKFAEGLPKRK